MITRAFPVSGKGFWEFPVPYFIPSRDFSLNPRGDGADAAAAVFVCVHHSECQEAVVTFLRDESSSATLPVTQTWPTQVFFGSGGALFYAQYKIPGQQGPAPFRIYASSTLEELSTSPISFADWSTIFQNIADPNGNFVYATNGNSAATGAEVFLVPALNAVGAMLLAALLVFSGIGCGGGSSQATPAPRQEQQPQPQAAKPSLLPPGGTFTGSQSVVISDTTAGATIYYTTDGAAPSASSLVYAGPISLNSATTVQVIATAHTTSTVASANYKFQNASGDLRDHGYSHGDCGGISKVWQLNAISLTRVVNLAYVTLAQRP